MSTPRVEVGVTGERAKEPPLRLLWIRGGGARGFVEEEDATKLERKVQTFTSLNTVCDAKTSNKSHKCFVEKNGLQSLRAYAV